MSSCLRILDEVQVIDIPIKKGDPIVLEYTQVPSLDKIYVEPVHVEVLMSNKKLYTAQILKPTTKQLSLEFVEIALKEIGIEGELNGNAYFIQNIDEKYELRLPLSSTQTHISIFDASLFEDGIKTYVFSDSIASFELNKNQLLELFGENTLTADVTFSNLLSVDFIDKNSSKEYNFSTPFPVVNHSNDQSIHQALTGDSNHGPITPKVNRLIGARPYDELQILYEGILEEEIGSNDDFKMFAAWLVDIINCFPSLHSYFTRDYYSNTNSDLPKTVCSISKMVENLGMLGCVDWMSDFLEKSERCDGPLFQTLTYMHQSDFSVMIDAVEKLCDELEKTDKLEQLGLDREMLLHMVSFSFYPQFLGYRLASKEELGGFLKHLILNKQFDLQSVLATFFKMDSQCTMRMYLTEANYPETLIEYALDLGRGLSNDPNIYSHVIACLTTMLARDGKLHVKMSDPSLSQLTSYIMDYTGIRNEMMHAIENAKVKSLIDRPALAKEIETKRSRIDLSFYAVE